MEYKGDYLSSAWRVDQTAGQTGSIGGAQVNSGVSTQPGFVSKGVFLPIYDTFVVGQAKLIM